MNISTHAQGSKTRLTALIAAALFCLMTLFGVSSASAHDELVATTPTNGAVLKTSPKELVMTFSGELKEIGTIINLKDAQGQEIATTSKISRRDLTVTPEASLPNGEYTLVTRVVSSDGHPIDKKLEFSVADPQAVATPEATKPVAPEANPAPSVQPTAENSVAPVEQPSAGLFAGLPTPVIWIVAGIAVVGFVATIVVRFRRQGK